MFSINNNNVGEEATHDIATILSHNTKLKVTHLNFQTAGAIKITRALNNSKTIKISHLRQQYNSY